MMVATTSQNRQFAQHMLGYDGLDEAIEWISKNMNPSDVFSEEELSEVGRDYAEKEGMRQPLELSDLDDYDPGLLNDYGGGNVDWWHDYIRKLINSCNEHWREQLQE